MHATTITALLATISLAAAAPTAHDAGSCQIQYPTQLFSVIESAPTQNTAGSGYVFTSQAAGRTNRYITELQFADIPAGAYGCSVEYFFAAGAGAVSSTPGTRLDFFVADRNVSAADTFWDRPGKGSLVGTQVVRASESEDTKLTVVTGACAETLNYVIEVQGEAAGSVGFPQFEGNGLRLTYNC